ncbi:Abi-alpha family protein [Aeromonas veronii]|uniref:Abi-alpha family protein n=1 Tax=Aeromonas veronii TaxID=654 RepID=UPI001CD46A52|nr:Abi-alpha family protein [Aeromonas veronii]UBR47341.1 DUF4393 domain-containing protein [Aeromonas veronii]
MCTDIESIKEVAKATQEVAKTTSHAITASQEVGGFLSKFISGPLEQCKNIVEDKLRYIRWERQIRLMMRAQQFLLDSGLPAPDNPIPLKNAVALFEYATLEEDNELQDLWARLLVNGTNKMTGIKIERAFIEILAQISSLEANILQKIYSIPFEDSQHNGILTANLPNSVMVYDKNDKDVSLLEEPSHDVKLALANLVRLGCVKLAFSWGGGEIFTKINPTIMGKELIQACTSLKV